MPDASAQAAVDLMVADVARFKQLVEDLLEISRFDAGAARLDLSEIRPGELATQSVAGSQTPDVPIELDSELAGVLIRADKRRLVRVIANLLDNARKYGGGATRMELIRLPAAIQIAVEDSGPGVPEAEREVIFHRFSRGAGSNRRAGSEGVGLGLSLVTEHVALHKGRVWVEDRPDGQDGARFVIELPVAWDEVLANRDQDDDAVTAGAHRSLRAGDAPRGRRSPWGWPSAARRRAASRSTTRREPSTAHDHDHDQPPRHHGRTGAVRPGRALLRLTRTAPGRHTSTTCSASRRAGRRLDCCSTLPSAGDR